MLTAGAEQLIYHARMRQLASGVVMGATRVDEQFWSVANSSYRAISRRSQTRPDLPRLANRHMRPDLIATITSSEQVMLREIDSKRSSVDSERVAVETAVKRQLDAPDESGRW
jgi:hypothetical protein